MSTLTGKSDRERALALVRRQGWNATSFQVLEPDFRYQFVGDDACVAYVDTGHAWVAAGAPLADEARMREVASAFVRAARAAGRRACFFATEERFTSLCPLRALLVGKQAVWDPARWDDALRVSRSLREQLRRVRAKGVRIRAVDLHQQGSGVGPSARRSPGWSIAGSAGASWRRWVSSHASSRWRCCPIGASSSPNATAT